jgi:hypothetical protein
MCGVGPGRVGREQLLSVTTIVAEQSAPPPPPEGKVGLTAE